MDTMEDLVKAVRAILPNALIVDTDEGILIETNLQLGLGGLLEPYDRDED